MAQFIVDEKSKAKIIAIIAALIPEARIYLFGSRARGANAEWSDIDLALDTGSKIDRPRVAEVIDVMVALGIPYKVDIVDLYAVTESMRSSILKDKIVWKA